LGARKTGGNKMIKLLVMGPNGKMGKAMILRAHNHPEMRVVGGVGPKGCRYSGTDLGVVAGIGENIGVNASDDIEEVIHLCDVVVECTNADTSLEILDKCIAVGKPLVSGTTGFTVKQKAHFQAAGRFIPVMLASNTSKVAHLFFRLIEWITEDVGIHADIDIIEMHDRNKLDAPSGTSLQIGRIIANGLGRNFDEIARYQKKSKGDRPPNTIDYTSIRTGNFSTSHKVIFGFENEKLELTIDGYNMSPYAAGMIEAVGYLFEKKPGFYKIEQMLASDC
jgi:4-hydroxy-tetrahydrodipicolinate reductase